MHEQKIGWGYYRLSASLRGRRTFSREKKPSVAVLRTDETILIKAVLGQIVTYRHWRGRHYYRLGAYSLVYVPVIEDDT